MEHALPPQYRGLWERAAERAAEAAARHERIAAAAKKHAERERQRREGAARKAPQVWGLLP
jgi:hypothetical protein